MSGERIEKAAVLQDWLYAHTLPPPHHHDDVLMSMMDISNVVEGFWTSTGRFVDREEGYRVAVAAGQLRQGEGGKPGVLHSEDLW